MSWWNGKIEIRQYLAEINREGIVCLKQIRLLLTSTKILEYTLFQPGLFLEYLAFPHKTAKYLQPLQTVFDFEKCRAIIVQGRQDAVMSLTSVKDVAAIIAKAVEFKGQWPTTFGIQGNRLTFHDILAIGERVRGKNHKH